MKHFDTTTGDDVPLERQIVSTRSFAASREQLFDAWISPARLARWWGPRGFTNTFEAFEPWPGGEWRFTMHGPDGTDYRNRSIFVEIIPLSRIVFDHVSGHVFRVVATFGAEGEGTRLTFRMIFDSVEERERIAKFAVAANEENLDRLEAELARER